MVWGLDGSAVFFREANCIKASADDALMAPFGRFECQVGVANAETVRQTKKFMHPVEPTA